MSKNLVSTRQLQRLTGASRFQLRRWAEAGLIPPPRVIPGPKGLGRQGVYPKSILSVVKRLLTFSGRGVPLSKVVSEITSRDADIGEQAKAQAERMVEAWQRTRVHKPATTLFEAFTAVMLVLLERGGIPPRLARHISRLASKPELVTQALQLVYRGFSPVLVYNCSLGPRILPDFAVVAECSPTVSHIAELTRVAGMEGEKEDIPGVWVEPVNIVMPLAPALMPVFSLAGGKVLAGWPEARFLPSPSVDELVRDTWSIVRYPLHFVGVKGGGVCEVSLVREGAELVARPKAEIRRTFAALRQRDQFKRVRPAQATREGSAREHVE